jgi:alpha-ribazole phosphatase
MTRVWLIRHGETAREATHLCHGSMDVGLSERGRWQMDQVAEYLRSEPIACIYSSPRSRAREGARAIASAVSQPVELVEDLREIDFGDFEGLPYDEIAVRYSDLYRRWMEKPTEVLFPNGESFAEMRTRILNAFLSIRRKHDGQTIAIVSHGGVNRIVLAGALQIPDECIFRLAQDYAAINLVAFTDGSPVVQLMNRTAG